MLGRCCRSALVVFLVTVALSADARAVTLTDNFSTNPFPTRWCERWHHLHWGGSSNQIMISFTAAPPCDSNGGGCCTICTTGCTSEGGNGSALITKTNYTGTTRSAGVDFRFPQPLDGLNDHLAVFPVFHPNCHTGYEAVVAPNGSGGYTLSVGRVTDSTRDECDNHDPGFSTSVTIPNLTTGTTPRYRLSLDIVPGGVDLLNSFALVWDNVTSQPLATKSWPSDEPESWYNTAAKRFGFNGVQTGTRSVNFDNFAGSAN